MAFYDSNDSDGSGFDPAPWQQAPADPRPETEPRPEAEERSEAAAGDVGHGPAKAKARPRRPRPAFAWTADRVRQAREALALLDDGRTRRGVASAADVDADDADRLALAVLKGGLSAPVGLLVAWHDETDPLRRAILVGQALEKDMAGVRRAARVALALAPDLAGSV